MYRSLSERAFPREREAGMDRLAPLHQCNDMPRNGGSVLEAMSRTAADKEHVGVVRVAIDEEISRRRVLVLTDVRVDQRRRGQLRKPSTEEGARRIDERGRNQAIGGVGIDRRTVAIDAHFEAGAVEIGDSVETCVEVDPHRKMRRGE